VIGPTTLHYIDIMAMYCSLLSPSSSSRLQWEFF